MKEAENITRREFLSLSTRFGLMTVMGSGLMEFSQRVEQEDLKNSFVKFRLAEMYFKLKGYRLAEKLMGHYLGGSGDKVDITKEYLANIEKSGLSVEEYLKTMVDNNLAVPLTVGAEKLTAVIIPKGYPDILWGMGAHTLEISKGSLRHKVAIKDKYTFDQEKNSMTVRPVFNITGREIVDEMMDRFNINSLEGDLAKLAIAANNVNLLKFDPQKEGGRLEQMGMVKAFDVIGELEFTENQFGYLNDKI